MIEVGFKCERCPCIIWVKLKVLSQDKKSIKIAKPAECFKEQNGCGRTAGSTDFELISTREIS